MRILFIDIVRTTIDDVWPTVEHSLGLMYLCAALHRRFGSKVETRIRTLLSRHVLSDQDREYVTTQLEQFQPEIVGIRCLSIGKDTLHAILPVIREWNEKCFLMVGGPHATDDPEDILRSGLVDCAVIGEGEVTVCEVVQKLMDGEKVTRVPGTALNSDGKIFWGPGRELIRHLDDLPFPDYTLVDQQEFSNRYLTFTSKIFTPHGNILTSRGCPYQCMYCHNILGKKFRVRSPENILEEIRLLHDKYGLSDFQIIDDVFNLNIRRAKRICDLIIDSDMEITLSFPNGVRGDIMDEELIDKMAEAGTKFISYAVETGSPRLQKLIRKNLNLDRIFDAIEYSNKVGIATRGFFMLGFPTETVEEATQTIDFAKGSSLTGATYFTVVYFPGTELFRLAQSLGYFTDDGDDGFEVRRDYVEIGEGPYEFSLETLRDLKRKAISEFAFTPERIENALRVLPDYFTQREIDGFFMSYVVSSQMGIEEIKHQKVRDYLYRYFLIAERFSRKDAFYV